MPKNTSSKAVKADATATTEAAPEPMLSEITLADVLKNWILKPENIEFAIGIPKEVTLGAIRAKEFPSVRGDGSLDLQDVLAWIERKNIPVDPAPEIITAIRVARGEAQPPSSTSPVGKPLKSPDAPVTFDDVLDLGADYDALVVESHFGIPREETEAARQSGELVVERGANGVLSSTIHASDLKDWIDGTGRQIVIPDAITYRVKEQRAGAVRRYAAEEQNRLEAQATAKERAREAEILRAKQEREQEDAAAEADARQRAFLLYVTILRRADNPKPRDSEELDAITSDYGISREIMLADRRLIVELNEARVEAAKAGEAAKQVRETRQALADMKARHAYELEEATHENRKAATRASMLSIKAGVPEQLQRANPRLFVPGSNPPRLLGEPEPIVAATANAEQPA